MLTPHTGVPCGPLVADVLLNAKGPFPAIDVGVVQESEPCAKAGAVEARKARIETRCFMGIEDSRFVRFRRPREGNPAWVRALDPTARTEPARASRPET